MSSQPGNGPFPGHREGPPMKALCPRPRGPCQPCLHEPSPLPKTPGPIGVCPPNPDPPSAGPTSTQSQVSCHRKWALPCAPPASRGSATTFLALRGPEHSQVEVVLGAGSLAAQALGLGHTQPVLRHGAAPPLALGPGPQVLRSDALSARGQTDGRLHRQAPSLGTQQRAPLPAKSLWPLPARGTPHTTVPAPGAPPHPAHPPEGVFRREGSPSPTAPPSSAETGNTGVSSPTLATAGQTGGVGAWPGLHSLHTHGHPWDAPSTGRGARPPCLPTPPAGGTP